jgi:hypothetical protein
VKLFISWSGKRSQKVAKALRTFLQDINQRIEPWMSETDISIGSRWAMDLARELEETQFGILCITQEALQSPWLLFEAGALSKSVRNARVCPYLIGLEKQQLTGPIAQFQCVEATEASTHELLKSINETMGNEGLKSERLQKYFNMFWPELKSAIESISSTPFLSPILHAKLRDLLISRLSFDEFRTHFFILGLPDSRVNWNQSFFNVYHEAIQVAFEAGKLIDYLNYLAEERPDIKDLQDIVEQLSSLKESKE